jgi:hypothetical protein
MVAAGWWNDRFDKKEWRFLVVAFDVVIPGLEGLGSDFGLVDPGRKNVPPAGCGLIFGVFEREYGNDFRSDRSLTCSSEAVVVLVYRSKSGLSS